MSIPSLNKTQGQACRPLLQSSFGLWISVIRKAFRGHSNVQVWRKDDRVVKTETKDKEPMLGGDTGHIPMDCKTLLSTSFKWLENML